MHAARRFASGRYGVAAFAGGNIGVRRRQLHALMLDPGCDDLATLDGICLAQTVC